VADDVRSVAEINADLGHRVRELRTAKGLSMRAFAAQVEVTSGFVSQLESAKVMPSVATLVRLASVLDVRVGDLFDAPEPALSIVRASERVTFEANPGVFDQVISSDRSQRLELIVGRIEPGGSSGPDLYTHGADVEVVLVTRGELRLRLGDESVVLREGDAVTFAGEVPHGYVNDSDATAEVIWAMTPSAY
jgi:transcriptional regulator with XRE-family HTH domain